jgi:hypothetical protein
MILGVKTNPAPTPICLFNGCTATYAVPLLKTIENGFPSSITNSIPWCALDVTPCTTWILRVWSHVQP